jgi:anti-anti-sigma factor
MKLGDVVRPTVPPEVLAASVSYEGASTVVTLRGEADLFTRAVVIDVLTRVIADTDGPVVVDLAETDFIDSSTLRAVGRAWEFLGDRGRRLTVRAARPVTIRILGVLGLSHVVEPAGGRSAQ